MWKSKSNGFQTSRRNVSQMNIVITFLISLPRLTLPANNNFLQLVVVALAATAITNNVKAEGFLVQPPSLFRHFRFFDPNPGAQYKSIQDGNAYPTTAFIQLDHENDNSKHPNVRGVASGQSNEGNKHNKQGSDDQSANPHNTSLSNPNCTVGATEESHLPVTTVTAHPIWEGNETLEDYYTEWIEYLLIHMKGENWRQKHGIGNRTGTCSENIAMKDRGCGILIPMCTKYAGGPKKKQHWFCNMVEWESCKCAKNSDKSILRFIMPKRKECYMENLTTTQLAKLISPDSHSTDIDKKSQIIIFLGRCRVSGFFVAYLCALGAAIVWVLYRLWPYMKPVIQKLKVKLKVKEVPGKAWEVMRSASRAVTRNRSRSDGKLATD